MILKCVGIIEMKNGFCDVFGKRLKKNGDPWLGVMSCGHIIVNGVAKFEIIKEE